MMTMLFLLCLAVTVYLLEQSCASLHSHQALNAGTEVQFHGVKSANFKFFAFNL